jgi:hypothetical protein
MRMAAFQRNRRVRFVAIGLLLAVAFTVFEIGVHLLPPDAVHYAAQETINGETVFTKSGTITDPATIARWRAAMPETPSGKFLWQQGGTCAPLGYYTATYVFLWHGLPIEVVSSLPGCGEQYEISSGGIPDPHTYYVARLVQP